MDVSAQVGIGDQTSAREHVGLSADARRASVALRQRFVRGPWIVAAAVVIAAAAAAAVVAGSDVPEWLGALRISSHAFDVASLHEATNAALASAHSIVQQPLTTASAAVLVAAAFGRSERERLVEESPARAIELQAQGDQAPRRGGTGT
jgi:hypothetical protein